MVGRKRLRVASIPVSSRAAKAESGFFAAGLNRDEHARDAFFLDLPVTPLEQTYFERDNLKPDGYLCLKLEIFLTHEPCMMCSMALVHSRVGRVIFQHRMPQTGGLTAEMVRNDSGPVGLGYGLCWRKELNWQFMCWEYTASRRAIAGGSARQHEDGKTSAAAHVARRTGAMTYAPTKGADGRKLVNGDRNGKPVNDYGHHGGESNNNDDDNNPSDDPYSQQHTSSDNDDENANGHASLARSHV